MLDKSMLVTFPIGTSDDVAYPPSSNCKWTFFVPSEVVSAAINFIKIDIENSEGCNFDHLRVVGRTEDGEVEYSSEKYCQEKNTVAPPIEFNSTVRQIDLLFTSDANFQKSGFSLLLRPIKESGSEFDCDFNYDSICAGWSFSNEPQSVAWKPGFGPTDTQGTGPDSDYSKDGDRGYLYVDASEILRQRPGDTQKWAYVATPVFDDSSEEGRDFCLEFYLHLFGDEDHIAPLNIIVGGNNGSLKVLKSVPEAGTKNKSSKNWKRVTIDFNKLDYEMKAEDKFFFQFVVAQVRGARADVAIDAVRLHKAQCSRLCPVGKAEFTCDAEAQQVSCVGLNKICDGEADCENDRDEKGCEEVGFGGPISATTAPDFGALFTTMAFDIDIGIDTTLSSGFAGFTTPEINFPGDLDFPNDATPTFPFELGVDTTPNPGLGGLFTTAPMFTFDTSPAVNLFEGQ